MKYLFLVCLLIGLVACVTQDEYYYRQNPQALEKALRNCPIKQPAKVSCEQLVAIAVSINDLAYRLQSNPQGFGKTILALQEKLAKQQAELQQDPNKTELEPEVEQTRQQLRERLAIVKWLESPES